MCIFGGGRLPAQAPAPAPSNTPQAAGAALKILVLEGQDTVNDVRVPMPTDLVVEVRDQNDRPIEGATVSFQLPLIGPSGAFDGGVRNKDVLTNVQGQAATTFTPNTEMGRMTIQVKAVAGSLSGMTTITERNGTGTETTGRKGSWIGQHKKLVIIAAVAAGGVVAAIALTRGGSKSSTSTPTGTTAITITPGVPTIGGAH